VRVMGNRVRAIRMARTADGFSEGSLCWRTVKHE
jgi:hypothetical protein